MRPITVSSSAAGSITTLRPDLSELNPLGQRKIGPPINGVGLAPHVGLPRVRAGLAPPTGFFFAPERAADLRSGGADVHVGNPTITAQRRQKLLAMPKMIGKQRGRQPLRH